MKKSELAEKLEALGLSNHAIFNALKLDAPRRHQNRISEVVYCLCQAINNGNPLEESQLWVAKTLVAIELCSKNHRLSIFSNLGKGRRLATDGVAYDAALECAVNHINYETPTYYQPIDILNLYNSYLKPQDVETVINYIQTKYINHIVSCITRNVVTDYESNDPKYLNQLRFRVFEINNWTLAIDAFQNLDSQGKADNTIVTIIDSFRTENYDIKIAKIDDTHYMKVGCTTYSTSNWLRNIEEYRFLGQETLNNIVNAIDYNTGSDFLPDLEALRKAVKDLFHPELILDVA